jgi:hypothetical protein
MRNFVCSFFLILTFLSNKQGFGQRKNLAIYEPYFDSELKAWTKTIQDFKLSSFKLSDSIAFDKQEYKDIKSLKDFYSIYKPALTFSKDSNLFIDIYSYELNLERKGDKIVYSGSEVDQAISLCNLKTKSGHKFYFAAIPYEYKMQSG